MWFSWFPTPEEQRGQGTKKQELCTRKETLKDTEVWTKSPNPISGSTLCHLHIKPQPLLRTSLVVTNSQSTSTHTSSTAKTVFTAWLLCLRNVWEIVNLKRNKMPTQSASLPCSSPHSPLIPAFKRSIEILLKYCNHQPGHLPAPLHSFGSVLRAKEHSTSEMHYAWIEAASAIRLQFQAHTLGTTQKTMWSWRQVRRAAWGAIGSCSRTGEISVSKSWWEPWKIK